MPYSFGDEVQRVLLAAGAPVQAPVGNSGMTV